MISCIRYLDECAKGAGGESAVRRAVMVGWTETRLSAP